MYRSGRGCAKGYPCTYLVGKKGGGDDVEVDFRSRFGFTSSIAVLYSYIYAVVTFCKLFPT
jgi:hypothetical protein